MRAKMMDLLWRERVKERGREGWVGVRTDTWEGEEGKSVSEHARIDTTC